MATVISNNDEIIVKKIKSIYSMAFSLLRRERMFLKKRQVYSYFNDSNYGSNCKNELQ